MNRYIYLGLFLAFGLSAQAQIGLTGSYTWFKADQWEQFVEQKIGDYQEEHFFQNGYQFGVDYWFRLKDMRIEFLPELRYAKYTAEPVSDFDEGMFHWQSMSFHWTTNVYPFDFFGDCDCPTFSKQDPIFKKGLFLQLSPGAHFLRQWYSSEKSLILFADQKSLVYSLGLGIGLDIGISDWITLSPFGRITRIFGGEWNGFEELPVFSDTVMPDQPLEEPYELWVPEAGLRLGLRWKH
ncbi:MAG: hypothetical protein IPJ00_16940 [Saprospirales bacterium]|nr:hypothetical protein [Saprospirales bacterium]